MIPPDQLEDEARERAALDRRFKLSPEIFSALLLLIPAILLSTTGELFFKRGMTEIGTFDYSLSTILPVFGKIISNPNIWAGGVGFVGGSVFWLLVISRVALSIAYPTLALSYFIVVVESWLFLGEKLTWQQLAGVAVIYTGVVIVNLSGGGGK
jgi:drug/metabolite transporter (DMT)-like permease